MWYRISILFSKIKYWYDKKKIKKQAGANELEIIMASASKFSVISCQKETQTFYAPFTPGREQVHYFTN